MPYAVTAKHREGIAGFRRDGRFFPSDTSTILQDEEMTDAIKSEPQLIVTKISAKDAADARKAPADPVEQIQAERDALAAEQKRTKSDLEAAQQRAEAAERDLAQLRAAQKPESK